MSIASEGAGAAARSGAPEREPDTAPDDWRILRALSYYRLLLTGLLMLGARGHIPYFFDRIDPAPVFRGAFAYFLAALLLLPVALGRRPRLAAQAHIQFIVDALGISVLVYAAHGISSGLAVLLLTPAVGCGSVVGTRMALLQAAIGTLLILAEELLRQSVLGFSPAEISAAGLLGLMLFATATAASAVAQRARRSEALAARVGGDLASLSRLNERIIESMETGVLVVESNRTVRLMNAATRRILGTSPQAEDLPLTRRCPELARALSAWELNPSREAAPLAPRAGGEEVIPRFMRLSPEPGTPILVLLDDARRLGEQAQQMKLAALGRLSASIAHEIRNPLSAIHHAGQLLAESPQNGADERRLLDVIQRQCGRINKTIEDVLSLSRREASAPATFALRAFLERALSAYAEGHPRNARSIEFGTMAEDLLVRFDPNHLQRIVHNMWDNSFEHGAHGSSGRDLRIQLSGGVLPPHDRVFLDISDNGSGIPAGLRDKVFEPFFTTAHDGTGLGLYLARELCEYNQGRLLLAPSERGVRFRLIFAA
ncbi:MAG: hypothetical protein ISP90_01735 [Nevskia sp.]|nr:hypothetical protein [Nevskia sp.]